MTVYNKLQDEFEAVPADETTGVYEVPEVDGLITGSEMYTDAALRSYGKGYSKVVS